MKPPIPPSWIDALLVLASPLHPPATIMLAVVLILMRRWGWLCYYGLMPLARQTEITPWSLTFLPGLASYMSSVDEGGTSSMPVLEPVPEVENRIAIPQQNQAEPAEPFDFSDVLDYLTRHNLTDEQAIDLLALIRRDTGDLLSANKIRDIVGGNDAAVKARVAAWRPAPRQQRTQGRAVRPHGGW